MGTVSCVCWLPAYMRQASTVVALTAGAMDSALSGNVDAPLFDPYVMGDVECEQVKKRYAVYVPPPLVNHLLGRELTTRQVWDQVRGGLPHSRKEHYPWRLPRAPLPCWPAACRPAAIKHRTPFPLRRRLASQMPHRPRGRRGG